MRLVEKLLFHVLTCKFLDLVFSGCLKKTKSKEIGNQFCEYKYTVLDSFTCKVLSKKILGG